MSFRKSLVLLGSLLVITMLLTVISCGSPTPPPPVKETVVVVQTVIAPAPPAPTAAPAPKPTEAPKPPVAVLNVMGVPANAALPSAITTTLTYMTSTVVGAAKTTIALGTSGLENTPINVPVRLSVSAMDPKNTGKPTWSIIAPPGSKAAIKDPAAMTTEFTPDVVGAYLVGVSLTNSAGLTSDPQYQKITAATFVGMTVGNCQQCHPQKYAGWSKTGHSHILSDNIDNKLTPDTPTHYSEACLRCHTVGYFLPAANNGGFTDAQAKTNWIFPTWDKIDAAGKKTGPSNFDTMPPEVKNMANVQCENCHGPASEHIKNSNNRMAVSFDPDTCDACHAGGGTHIKGLELAYSKHQAAGDDAWNVPTGPAEGAAGCVRCHTAKGYASFVANPKNPAAWNNEKQPLSCAGCHDPHSDANYAQLRVVGKPLEVPFAANAKDVGLSATCETCHNNRTLPENATKNSYPHYSSAAEMLNNLGGVTYGIDFDKANLNSGHALLVGVAPVPNPAYDAVKNPDVAKFMWSGTDDAKGNVPGPCVFCHMQPTITDAKDPNQYKVGDHSFNTVSPDGKLDYGVACKGCHGTVTDFNLKAKADYDGNGKVEGDQDEMKGLLNVLWNTLVSKGVKKIDSGFPYGTLPQNADAKIQNAWYNYRYVYGVMWGPEGPGGEGKAAAVHNFKRSVALLQLSLKDLGALPAAATDITK